MFTDNKTKSIITIILFITYNLLRPPSANKTLHPIKKNKLFLFFNRTGLKEIKIRLI